MRPAHSWQLVVTVCALLIAFPAYVVGGKQDLVYYGDNSGVDESPFAVRAFDFTDVANPSIAGEVILPIPAGLLEASYSYSLVSITVDVSGSFVYVYGSGESKEANNKCNGTLWVIQIGELPGSMNVTGLMSGILDGACGRVPFVAKDGWLWRFPAIGPDHMQSFDTTTPGNITMTSWTPPSYYIWNHKELIIRKNKLFIKGGNAPFIDIYDITNAGSPQLITSAEDKRREGGLLNAALGFDVMMEDEAIIAYSSNYFGIVDISSLPDTETVVYDDVFDAGVSAVTTQGKYIIMLMVECPYAYTCYQKLSIVRIDDYQNQKKWKFITTTDVFQRSPSEHSSVVARGNYVWADGVVLKISNVKDPEVVFCVGGSDQYGHQCSNFLLPFTNLYALAPCPDCTWDSAPLHQASLLLALLCALFLM